MTAAPSSVAELRRLAGVVLGPTDWFELNQERVDAFAEVTEDRQWIHVDVPRADAELGGTIAHGLFTLALGPRFTDELLSFHAFSRALNYGYDRVRFPAPVPVGSRVRMRLTVGELQDVGGGAQLSVTQTFEREGSDKPVCVATALVRIVDR